MLRGRLFLEYIYGIFLYLISSAVPKSKNIWIFGSWGGEKFADNPKYLFNYVNQSQQKIKSIWLSHNKEVVTKIREEGKLAYKTSSFLGIWYSCRAKVGVVSHGMIDINRYACARISVVQTWHGIPMKPVLLSDPKQKTISKRKKLKALSVFFPFLKKELNYESNLIICSTSEFVTNILKKVFGEKSPITETGFPKLDSLLNLNNNNSLIEEIRKSRNFGIKVGIYMPTYRQEGEFNIINYLIDNIEIINKVLVESRKVLYLKIHPFDFYKIPKNFSYQGIKILKNEQVDNDIYSVLGFFDFLITDYSSVAFDYLFLSRPIYFLDPDRKSYITTNGKFVYDYKNFGLPCYSTWKDLLNGLSQEFPLDKNTMNQISNKLHKYRDTKSSKRLYENIVSKINK